MGFLKRKLNSLFNKKVDSVYGKALIIYRAAELQNAIFKEYASSEFYDDNSCHIQELSALDAQLSHLKPEAKNLTIQCNEFERENNLYGVYGTKKFSSSDFLANQASIAKTIQMNNIIVYADEIITNLLRTYSSFTKRAKTKVLIKT